MNLSSYITKLMEFLKQSYNAIELILINILGIIGIILLVFLSYSWVANIITIIRFKREWGHNNNNFSVKRCSDEGEVKDGRDHFYLVDTKNGKYHHINPYTLGRLGYPRPPRVNEEEKDENKKFYFKKEDGYQLGHEIKIRNIISFINTIKDLKN
jgi:hypothetical protein